MLSSRGRENAREHPRMEGLDASTEDLGEARVPADLEHLAPGVGQSTRRASGGDDFPPQI